MVSVSMIHYYYWASGSVCYSKVYGFGFRWVYDSLGFKPPLLCHGELNLQTLGLSWRSCEENLFCNWVKLSRIFFRFWTFYGCHSKYVSKVITTPQPKLKEKKRKKVWKAHIQNQHNSCNFIIYCQNYKWKGNWKNFFFF
jgi:hypothetical protein